MKNIIPNKLSFKKYGFDAALLFFAVFFVTISAVIYLLFRNPEVLAFNGGSKESSESIISEDAKEKEESSVFKSLLNPVYTDPVEIEIPSVNIKAVITKVGLDSDGALQTPKSWLDAGWYKGSSRPGEKGNLIINAHYDDSSGRPAAFWELKNVKLDDKVVLTDSFGRKYEYKVVNSSLIDINDPNRLEIFESPKNGSAVLTLITCGGVWIPGKATYNKRLALQGELIR